MRLLLCTLFIFAIAFITTGVASVPLNSDTQNLNAIQLNYPSIKSIGDAIQKFDRARMIVLKMDSETYMGILD